MHSAIEAVKRHPEITVDPKTLKILMESFEVRPPGSTKALLIRMGPFRTDRHGFRFCNTFQITETNARQLRERVKREIVERSIEAAALGPIRDALHALKIKIPIPLLPDVEITLPTEIIGRVIEPLPEQGIELLFDEIAGKVSPTYGRCGGMAFAGYDFYLRDFPVDERLGTTPPNTGPLGDYIFNRLLDSLDLNIGTFLEWVTRLHILPVLSQAATAALLAAAGSATIPGLGTAIGLLIGSKVVDLGGTGPILADTKGEWTRLKQILDEQAAWPVGLIFGDSAIPWDQHQLLAVGYRDNGDGTESLITWDNRFSFRDTVYELDFTGSELISRRAPALKGFFAETYEPRVPPRELHLV